MPKIVRSLYDISCLIRIASQNVAACKLKYNILTSKMIPQCMVCRCLSISSLIINLSMVCMMLDYYKYHLFIFVRFFTLFVSYEFWKCIHVVKCNNISWHLYWLCYISNFISIIIEDIKWERHRLRISLNPPETIYGANHENWYLKQVPVWYSNNYY